MLYALASLSNQNLAEQCLCHLHSADLSLVVSAHRLAFARHSYADPLHSVTIPEQFAPQQFPLCSQHFYRYSHHCYTLPYPSGTNLRHSTSMSCLALPLHFPDLRCFRFSIPYDSKPLLVILRLTVLLHR